MTTFLKVTAMPCNAQGLPGNQSQRTSLNINPDIIAGVKGIEVYIKGGDIVRFGDSYYTKFYLVNPAAITAI